MAAGLFEVVKQGDVYRILYAATSFGSGKTVTATPYNPSGSAQTAITLTEVGSTGIYQADFDTTGKALGSWLFVIKQLAVTQAAMKIQIVDPATLNDTVLEVLKSQVDLAVTELQSATYGLAKIETDVAATKVAADAVKTDVESGSTGLAAIKTAVDAIATQVSHIQNNTLNTLALPTSVVIPATGSTTRRIFMNIFNENGSMEDPDSNHIQVKVYLPDGTDVTTSYLTGVEPIYMTRDALGQYHADFAVNNADAETALTFKFTYAEGGNSIVRDAIVQLVSSSSDYSSILGSISDKVDDVKDVVDGIDTKATSIKSTVETTDGKVDTIGTNVSSVKSTVETMDGKVDTINSNVSTVKSDVATVKSDVATIKSVQGGMQLSVESLVDDMGAVKGEGFVSSTDSLRAIRVAISGYLASGGSIKTLLDGITTGQGDIKGTGFDSAVDSLKAISDRVYTGGIAL
jgi:archaellum component FlaC